MIVRVSGELKTKDYLHKCLEETKIVISPLERSFVTICPWLRIQLPGLNSTSTKSSFATTSDTDNQ